MIARLLTAASALALTACVTGPDYRAVPVSPTAAAPFIGASPATNVSSAQPIDNWWQLYRDPMLDELVADALAANTDVRVAVASLAKARAQFREERGAREPQLGVGTGAQYGRRIGAGAPGDNSTELQATAQGSVAYEVDLFNRIGRRVEAARGDSDAAAADIEAVRLAVVADTVRAYMEAASLADRSAVGTRIVDLLDRSLDLIDRRYRAGLANGLDTARIAALRDQRRAAVPILQAQRQRALLRLATLTGRAPRELPQGAAARASAPILELPIAVGDGRGLLARRPDVRASERRLAAATARIGVATADLYPRITLGGSAASTASGLGNILTGNPISWLVGPLLSWTANRTAARARVAGAEADTQAALASFDGKVLTALKEVEAALSDYRQAVIRRDALRDAAGQAGKVVRIARVRQREGDISSLETLDSERTAADAEDALADSEAAVTFAQIEVFRAVGGRIAR